MRKIKRQKAVWIVAWTDRHGLPGCEVFVLEIDARKNGIAWIAENCAPFTVLQEADLGPAFDSLGLIGARALWAVACDHFDQDAHGGEISIYRREPRRTWQLTGKGSR